MHKRISVLAAVAVSLVVAGCSSPDNTEAQPRPTGAAQIVAPIIVEGTTTDVQAVLGRDHIVFSVDNPIGWTAEITPAGVVRFVAGSDNGSYRTNPGLELLAAGTAEVRIIAADGTVRTHVITVVDPAVATIAVTPTPSTGPAGGPVDSRPTTVPSPATEEDAAAAAAAAQQLAPTLVGLDEQQAMNAISEAGFVARVVERDGETFAVTMDFSPTRINLAIDDNVVTRSTVG